jgi:hypothetical protein
MDRSQMLKLMYKLNKIFNVLNKYIYILPLFTLLSSLLSNITILKDNKLFIIFKNIIKLLIIINLVLGVGVVLYFTDITTPLNNTYSLYYDLLEPYIELIKGLWNKLITYFHNSQSNSLDIKTAELESVLRDSTLQIKNEVKAGIKEGIIEALNEMEVDERPNYLKQIALLGSGVFFIYFLIILPGPSISPEALTEFNWFDQTLIELKIIVKDYFINKPGNPGDPGNTGTISPSTVNSPTLTNLNTYFPIEGSNSGSSEGLSTVTPNTPIVVNTVDVETQTVIDALTVGKMLETVNILTEVLPAPEATQLIEGVNSIVKNITD